MSLRLLNSTGFLACAGLLAYAYYLQFYEYLDPCPLCIFQRVAFIALAAVFVLAAVFSNMQSARRWMASLVGLVAAAGAAIAAWHIWLQHLPADEVPECGPGLDFMLRTLPLTDTLAKVFTASGECAEISWTLFGISLPGWALIWFVLLGIAGAAVNLRRD